MGRVLLLGIAEVLGRLDVLAGRRMIVIADVRLQPSGSWLIERFEMIGETARRLESLEWPESKAARLLRPKRLYLEAPETATSGTPASAWSLHPLLLYEHETSEVFFLNARRGRQRIEYLCYQPGRTMERDDLDTAAPPLAGADPGRRGGWGGFRAVGGAVTGRGSSGVTHGDAALAGWASSNCSANWAVAAWGSCTAPGSHRSADRSP